MRSPEHDDPPPPDDDPPPPDSPMTAEEFVTALDPIEDDDPPAPEQGSSLDALRDVGRHAFGIKYEGDK